MMVPFLCTHLKTQINFDSEVKIWMDQNINPIFQYQKEILYIYIYIVQQQIIENNL